MDHLNKLFSVILASLILFSLFLHARTLSQVPSLPPILLLPGHSLHMPLSPYLPASNITFNLSDIPDFMHLMNPLQSSLSVPLDPTLQNSTALYLDYTTFAFIDQQYNVYYASYQGNNSINISSYQLSEAIGSECTSIAPYEDNIFSLVLTCGAFQNSSGTQNQLTYIIFYEASQPYSILELNFTLPYENLQAPLQTRTSFLAQDLDDWMLITYFDSETLLPYEPIEPLVCVLYSPYGQSCGTPGGLESISLKKIEAVTDGAFFLDSQGAIYYSAIIDGDLQNLTLVIDLNDKIIESCSSVKGSDGDEALVAVSNNKLYYLLNSQLAFTYTVPDNYSAVSCALDSKFLYVIVQSDQDNTLQTIVYDLESTNTNSYLIGIYTGLSEVYAVSASQTPGSISFLSQDTFWTANISEPLMELQNVQESILYNITLENSSASLFLNITVIPEEAQIFENTSVTPLSSFSPLIDLQKFIIGPSLGIISDGVFAGGVYGPFMICNFEDLNLIVYEHLYVKIAPLQQHNFTNNSIPATIVFTAGPVMGYIDILINNPYPTNSSDTCAQQFQLLDTLPNSLYIKNEPDRCLIGTNFDVLLVNGSISTVIETYGVYNSRYDCLGAYLWQNYTFGQDYAVCINSQTITFLTQSGYSNNSFSATQVGVSSFLTNIISTHPSISNFIVIAYPQGLVGLYLWTYYEQITVVFKLEVDFSQNSYLQLTPTRLVLADFDANTITEWDISILSSPYLIGDYPLFSFQLDPSVQPTYHPEPNHLIFAASDSSIPYLLTFQPGNQATSVLLYAIDIRYITGEISTDQRLGDLFTISTSYDPGNKTTLFFISNESIMGYFYAFSSPKAPLAQVINQNSSLFNTGTATIQVTSSINTSSSLDLNIPYRIISSQQPIATTQSLSGLSVVYNQPIHAKVTDYFEGTLLDYNITNFEVNQQNAVYIQTPLNLSRTLLQSVPAAYYSSPSKLTLFSDGAKLFILCWNYSSFINLKSSPLQIQNFTLLSHAPSLNFIAGDSDIMENITAFAYNLNESIWEVYIYPVGLTATIQEPIINIKVVSSLIFVLVEGPMNLIYVLSVSENISLIMTIQSEILNFVPKNFDATMIDDGDTFAVVIIDGSDTLYNIVVNADTQNAQTTVFYNFTQNLQYDMPPEPLKIVAIQLTNQSSSNSSSTADFMLTISNFHSYQIRLAYDVQNLNVQFDSVLTCFVQMVDHVSFGNSFTTNFYFLDVKQKEGIHYLYSYPLDLTYDTSSSQNGSYSYVMPIQRQVVNATVNISLYCTNLHTGKAFYGISQITGYYNETVELQVFNVSQSFEIGYSNGLSKVYLSDSDVKQISLTLSNDFYSLVVDVTLDLPTQNFFTTIYFLVLITIVMILFCCLFIWYCNKACKQRQQRVRVAQSSENYAAINDGPEAAPQA